MPKKIPAPTDNWTYYPQMLPTGVIDFKDKEAAVRMYVKYAFNRLMRMLKVNGLDPEKDPPEMFLKLNAFTHGHSAIVEYDGKLWSLWGNFAEKPDAYYLPTKYIIANPYLNYYKTLDIKEDMVLHKNDSMMMGFLPICNRYASMIAETDVTLMMADTNTRAQMIISAQDDRTAAAAKTWIDKLQKGDLDVIGETPFLEGLKTNPYAGSSLATTISQTIELRQYIRGCWWNDVGLQMNWNGKREALNSAETGMNEQYLKPILEDVLENWSEMCEGVNKKYVRNWSVELGESWKEPRSESEADQDPNQENKEGGEDGERKETD